MVKFDINLESLGDFLLKETCPHTFQHSFEWAAKNHLPKEAIEELANELDVHCDCELVKIIDDVGNSFEVDLDPITTSESNPWKVPPDFVIPPLNKAYHQLIVSPSASTTDSRCYTHPDEILIPAPMGYKPLRKMRKTWHFFVGLESGFPSEIGLVKSCMPITAVEWLEKVKESCLVGFEDFDLLVASVYLEQTAKMAITCAAGVHFLEEFDGLKTFTRIRITKRLL